MNKKELIKRAVDVLKDNNIKKNVGSQKTILHVSDDSGNHSDFAVKKEATAINFNIADVTAILDALLAVTEDAVKHGEDVAIHGFGSVGLRYREATHTFHPDTKEPVEIAGHYVTKFYVGNALKMAAKLYNLSLEGKHEEEGWDEI